METDKQLLELAAKAAEQERSAAGDLWSNARGCLWNPLEDDGDALRLAVKLSIHLGFYGDHVAAQRTGSKLQTEQRRDGDIPAATRRAIVRAAAALGERDANQA